MRGLRSIILRLTLISGALIALSINCSEPTQLYQFQDCDELEAFLKDQVKNPTIENTRPQGGVNFLFGCAAESDMMMEAPSEDGAERASTMAEPEPQRIYTTTNVQEVEVDEADFVKNDGDHILMLRRGHLVVLDAWPAAATHVIADVIVDDDPASAQFVGNPFTMFFDGERVLVIGSAGAAWQPVREGALNAPEAGGVVLSLFDVSSRGAPALLRRVRIDGGYVDARRVGSDVLLVTSAQLAWPWVETGLFGGGGGDVDAASLDEILPGLEDQVVGQDAAPRRQRACACENTLAPANTDGRSMVLVHALSMADESAPIRSTGVLTTWAQVYASDQSLYLASTQWYDGGYFTPNFAESRIYKFDAFAGDGAANFTASTVLDGEVRDSFSMNESDGDLRVVVTNREEQLTSSLLVLEQEGDSLIEVGRVDHIGDDEWVQSVRFIGDKAYIVTYPEPEGWRPVPPPMDSSCFPPPPPPGNARDPLWVVDLAEPHAPRLRGELEVEGYSRYIHPLGEDHLLTIGMDTNTSNVVQGILLSIFDVSDPDSPRLVHRRRMGDGSSVSEAVANHHAFTFFPELGVLAVPLTLVDWDCATPIGSTGLEVFRVDVQTGFSYLGRLEQTSLFTSLDVNPDNGGCVDVRRSVMIGDDTGNFVYAISTGGVSVAEIAEGLPEVAQVPLWSFRDPVCPVIPVPL